MPSTVTEGRLRRMTIVYGSGAVAEAMSSQPYRVLTLLRAVGGGAIGKYPVARG